MECSDRVGTRTLAKRYGVQPATVLAWYRRGWIPALRAGRRPVLFDVLAVDQALSDRAKRNAVARD